MDIRIARTDRAIEQAFMELREKNPLEKIKIKDLCAMACINKSTFYAHYEDIYALANALENKLIESILASVPRTNDSVALHQAETLTRELFHAFMQNQRAVNILFSGSRQGIFANSIEKGLRQRFEEADPTFAADLNRGILLSFCVQGCFYAFANNSSRMDESKLVELLGAIAKAAQSIEFYDAKLFRIKLNDIQQDLGGLVHPLDGGAFADAVEVEAAGAEVGAGQTLPA